MQTFGLLVVLCLSFYILPLCSSKYVKGQDALQNNSRYKRASKGKKGKGKFDPQELDKPLLDENSLEEEYAERTFVYKAGKKTKPKNINKKPKKSKEANKLDRHPPRPQHDAKAPPNRMKRVFASEEGVKWPNRTIPYEIDLTTYTDATNIKSIFLTAVDRFNEAGCLQWVPRTTETEYIRVVGNEARCASYVGHLGWSQQTLWMYESGCIYIDISLHEMLHAAGTMHEQSRAQDRDKLISFNWAAVSSGNELNYQGYSLYNAREYDLSSVLQYGLTYGSTTYMYVNDPDLEYLTQISQTDLSFYDKAELNAFYRCADDCKDPPFCQNGGFVKQINGICGCECVDGLTGTDCTELDTSLECGGSVNLTIGSSDKIEMFEYQTNLTCTWLIKTPKKIPKSKFRQYSPTRLINAYQAVKERGQSVRKAAMQYNVPTQTLRDRIKGKVDLEKVTMGPAPLLGQEEEAMLVSHLKAMTSFGYRYTRKEVTTMASDYAIHLRKKTKQQKPLTLKWFRGFMKRWPDLKVVKPRALEYQRSKSSNPGNVKRYFSILTKYNLFDKPHRIFNVDEKGITLNHAPPHVVSGAGDTPQAVTTGKSSTITILGCGSASGVAIPPYFVFPGMRMRTELMEGSTPGTAGDVTESGWSNSIIFLQYLQSHFVHYVPGGLDEPVLLLLDGHRSHASVEAVEWAKEHNIVLHVLQAHTSHILQPMDVGCYGPLQKNYNNLCHQKMRSTSTVIIKQDVCALACQAYSKALSAQNLQSAFCKCGIYPFNADVVTAGALAPSSVLTQRNEEEDKSDSDLDVDENNNSLDFFAERTRELVHIKSEGLKAKKERKTLSKITSGRAITEPEVSAKIMEHVSAAAAPKQRKNIKNQKLPTTSTKKSKSPKCGNKKRKTSTQTKGHSQEPGPSHVQPIDNTSSRQYILSEDSEDVSISEEELCCIIL